MSYPDPTNEDFKRLVDERDFWKAKANKAIEYSTEMECSYWSAVHRADKLRAILTQWLDRYTNGLEVHSEELVQATAKALGHVPPQT